MPSGHQQPSPKDYIRYAVFCVGGSSNQFNFVLQENF
jgi:hypothetical protein